MKTKFTLLTLFTAMMLFMSNSSCDSNTTDKNLQDKQEQLMKEASAQCGMPAIKNFAERKLMKMILEKRDNPKLICYAYLQSEMTGKLTFLGKCIGYGLPYSTQYTNPQRLCYYNETHETGNISLPQADPNGLYMPQSAEGTWLLLINPETNEPEPIYVEPRVVVSPFKINQ